MMALARPNAVDESDRDSESRSCEDEKAAERRRVFKRDSLDFTNLTQELIPRLVHNVPAKDFPGRLQC